MSGKTILKLYPNGNFETVDTQLIQSGVTNNYKFAENLITVPKIIEYPPPNVRNYFIEKTSVPGYINGYESDGVLGAIMPPGEEDRTSDFIDVDEWISTTIRVRYKNMQAQHQAWVHISFYDSAKQYLSTVHDDFVGQYPSIGDYTFEYKIPTDVAFLRLSTNFYDTPGVEVKISVEQGNTTATKHYLAPEDMPEWVLDTGRPISFFSEGIVIKGSLIQTNNQPT